MNTFSIFGDGQNVSNLLYSGDGDEGHYSVLLFKDNNVSINYRQTCENSALIIPAQNVLPKNFSEKNFECVRSEVESLSQGSKRGRPKLRRKRKSLRGIRESVEKQNRKRIIQNVESNNCTPQVPLKMGQQHHVLEPSENSVSIICAQDILQENFLLSSDLTHFNPQNAARGASRSHSRSE